jgi:hypothetical protein
LGKTVTLDRVRLECDDNVLFGENTARVLGRGADRPRPPMTLGSDGTVAGLGEVPVSRTVTDVSA